MIEPPSPSSSSPGASVGSADPRRRRILRAALWATVFLSLFWAIFNLTVGSPAVSLASLGAASLLSLPLVFKVPADHANAVKFYWVVTVLQVTGFTIVVLGTHTRVHFYLLVLGMLPMLLLALRAHRVFVVGSLLTSWLLFYLLDTGVLPTLALFIDMSLDLRALAARINMAFTLLLMGAFVGFFIVDSLRAEEELESAHAEADRLLRNVLPAAIVERLKAGESTIADGHDEVTVLFADVVGFTALSETITPTELVHMLDELICRFDRHTSDLGLEKIKIIGDAYMVAGGLAGNGLAAARQVADLALAMQDEVHAYQQRSGRSLSLRIGMHTGPLVAGVIGESKFSYDIWGDTVNTAARMESHGVPDRIQISDHTRMLLESHYRCVPRGEIQVKGKGSMTTHFLLARQTADGAEP